MRLQSTLFLLRHEQETEMSFRNPKL